jgi:hypothetical protein
VFRIRRLRSILFWRRLTRRWVNHRHTDNSAALAFYALISLPPLLLIGVTVASMVIGEKSAHGELEKQFAAVLGPELAETIEGILQSARIAPRSEPMAFVVAMLTLLYAGSHVLSKLRKTLNVVNESAPADPTRPWLRRVGARVICAGLILVFGAMLVAATVLQGFIAYIAARMDAPWLDDLNLLQDFGWLSTYLFLTRLVTGPGDFTPTVFRAGPMGKTTAGSQMATAVAYNSPLNHWADSAEAYLAQPEEVVSFIRTKPVAWDETRVLPGSKIGEIAAIARRSGSDWWIGIINGTDEVKEYSFNPGFLGQGNWSSIRFADVAGDKTKLQITKGSVTPGDKIPVTMQPGGGFVMILGKRE